LNGCVSLAGDDAKSKYYGIFARRDIKAKSELITIPKQCLMSANWRLFLVPI